MRKLTSRILAITSPQGWLIVAAAFVATFGQISFRFWHWGPDTRYYLAWTYRLMGHSEHDAGQMTYTYMLGRFDWFKTYCYFACQPDSPEATYGHLFHGEAGAMVATRLVYPLLSVPFVWLLGPRGMLVIPMLAYAAAVVMMMVLISRTVGRNWSVLGALSIILPTTVSAYGLYTYTEAPAMALVVASLLVLPIGRTAIRRDWIIFGVLLLLLAFTRQFHYILLAAIGLAWLGALARRGMRNEWLPFLLISAAVTAAAATAQMIIGSEYSIVDHYLRMTGSHDLASGLAQAPTVALNLIKQDIQDVGADISLVLICTLAVIGLLWRFKTSIALLTLGSVLGTFLLNVLNTEPSHFRYYITAFPIVAALATGTVADLIHRSRSPLFAPPPQAGDEPAPVPGQPRLPAQRPKPLPQPLDNPT